MLLYVIVVVVVVVVILDSVVGAVELVYSCIFKRLFILHITHLLRILVIYFN